MNKISNNAYENTSMKDRLASDAANLISFISPGCLIARDSWNNK